MVDFPYDPDLAPGTWCRSEHQGILLKCPYGHIGVMAGHQIGEDGKVTPSVVCPHEGCLFHNHVRLLPAEEAGHG